QPAGRRSGGRDVTSGEGGGQAGRVSPLAPRSRSTSGYSAWRLIAEELRREIVGGARGPGAKLPPEGELAERFGVHRNTVRQAVAALAAEHLVVSRRGSGTFVAEHTVLVHRIGPRTRLSDSLGRRGRASAPPPARAPAGAGAAPPPPGGGGRPPPPPPPPMSPSGWSCAAARACGW